MTREEILRNAEALANTLTDETVRGLIQHAYIKGAEDNAVGDSETFAEHYGCVPEPENEKGFDAVPVRFEEEDGEKHPVVDYKLMGRKAAELSVEDKQLVLKDISARVPYKVKFQNENIPTPNVATLDMTYLRMFEIREGVIFKPYLRPRSSMTEAEKDEEFKMCSLNCSEREMADFFNKHHLDYNGLIEKGLAIEAPEGMYKKENLIMANSPQLNEQKPYGQRDECKDCQVNYAGACNGSCEMKRSEQKLVEIDEEINRWMGCEAFPEGINITPLPQAMEIVERTAKHFFELGEKTVPSPGGYWEGFKDGVRECQAKLRDVKGAMKEHKPINQCNTHEPSLDEARKWNEAYEKGYSLGYKNGRNEQKSVEWSEEDEKIRKKLIEYFSHYREDREWWEGITPRDIIVYLERQKVEEDGEKHPLLTTNLGVKGKNTQDE